MIDQFVKWINAVKTFLLTSYVSWWETHASHKRATNGAMCCYFNHCEFKSGINHAIPRGEKTMSKPYQTAMENTF